ncbi:TPA: hypothetical protein U1X32_000429 [Streptococcus suis]|uniref:hypothetical protein n=1 Tax=Streptococcus suis TaxID=1307 RepID=UPI00042460AA|nr:hypothetical protein [Streptococcus suis]NQK32249.1 hypothetical protein [Streptococcus suis]NQL69729.1 hypothetical protein [Streptococcus suis]WNF81981.1 hypothetical protein RJW48_11795 [Streptococcus suis]HEM3211010.1 hypothetical protein [Streptococcus suis NT77]HEM4293003.1 hypothetical protein [Streptococcus suis]
MSSEQQERQAFQYLERSSFLTLRTFLKILDWSVKRGLYQETAYKLGLQTLADLVKTPFAIDVIDLKTELLDKPVDVEKLKEVLIKENLPLAISFQDDYLYFYTKDRSLLDTHLDTLLKELVNDPDKLKELVTDKTLDEEIALAKESIVLSDSSSVKTKEMVL